MATKSAQRPPRVILGIDPGVALIGYAVLRETRGKLTPIACDVIRTPAGMPLDARLLLIYAQMTALLTRYRPTEVAMETLLFGKNKKTAMHVSHARGVLMLTFAQQALPISEYSPTAVKLAVVGEGRAKKPQVGQMVQAILALPSVPRPDDAADAAAIAICHAHTGAWSSL